MVPKPLQKLYDRASLFLDKESTHQDHYWAVGIHKAIHAAYPDCGGSHTATTTVGGSSACQDPPLIRNHVCDTPKRCSVASIARELRREDEKNSSVVLSTPSHSATESKSQLSLFNAV